MLYKQTTCQLILVLACCAFSGCAAITSPTANGVPPRILHESYLAEPKEANEPIPLTWLRTKPVLPYKLDKGDILGVYIEGVLPERNQILPINFPDSSTTPPSTGVPIPVRENGTVALPLIEPVDVRGMTVEEAEARIIKAYTVDKEILQEEEYRILVNLARPRHTRVLVIREDAPQQRRSANDPSFRLFGTTSLNPQRTQGAGFVIELPTVEADLLSALANTGGLPGPTAASEIIIYRGFSGSIDVNTTGLPNDLQPSEDAKTVRIPLMLPPGSKQPFDAEDVRLRQDDIIYIPPRISEVYYTGGILPAREVPLPLDDDLRAVEAVLRSGGSILNGGRFANNFSGTSAAGLGDPNPSLLTLIRSTPGGGQVNIRIDLNRALRDPRENLIVKHGDILLLQETPSEAVARYLTGVFRLQNSTNVFTSGSSITNAAGSLP